MTRAGERRVFRRFGHGPLMLEWWEPGYDRNRYRPLTLTERILWRLFRKVPRA